MSTYELRHVFEFVDFVTTGIAGGRLLSPDKIVELDSLIKDQASDRSINDWHRRCLGGDEPFAQSREDVDRLAEQVLALLEQGDSNGK